MKNRILRPLWGGGLLAFLAAAVLSAQSTTTMTLTNVNGESMGPAYTSPYYATVGGVSNVPVICDDFAADSYLGESWTAYVTTLPQIPTSTAGVPLWQKGNAVSGTAGSYALSGTIDQTQAYITAAILATDILQLNNIVNPSAQIQTEQEELSYAIWGLFDSTALTVSNMGSSQAVSAAEGYLKTAEAAAANDTLSEFANVTVYTYDPNKPCSGPNNCTATVGPQEFISVSMAEPSSPAVLALDLLAVAGLVVFFRRRISGLIN